MVEAPKLQQRVQLWKAVKTGCNQECLVGKNAKLRA